jgi:hypothetical protein
MPVTNAYIALLALVSLAHAAPCHAQEDPAPKVEKIYLHLDKPCYLAGEYIYFRAYLVDERLRAENVSSRIIYVELSDADKNTVSRTLLYSDSCEYAGQIRLPPALPAACYHLRAYTSRMRNEGEDFFYHRDIYVSNTLSAATAAAPVQAFDYDVSFFPEGGRLLKNTPAKVACKAVANDGAGAQAAGVLKDQAGTVILHFNTLHAGMGFFVFTPEENAAYTVSVQCNGIRKEYALPLAAEGAGLSVAQDRDSIYLTIRSTRCEPEPVRVTGQSGQTLCYAMEGILCGRERQMAVSKNKFPAGIARFTLFVAEKPASERLVFVDREEDKLFVEMLPDRENAGDREKIGLEIWVANADGTPAEGVFSLAATCNEAVAPSTGEHNIKGSLLLDADLKGYVESPGWYFAGDEPERAQALDNLLCTQGWSRPADAAVCYPAEKEFQITGTLTTRSGRPAKDGHVSLLGYPPAAQADEADTDGEGRFSFSGLDCRENTVFVLQGRSKSGSTDVYITLDEPDRRASLHTLPRARRDTLPAPRAGQTAGRPRAEDSIRTVQLENINITAPKDAEAERRRIQSGMFSSIIGKDRLTDAQSLFTKLKGSVEVARLAAARPPVRPAKTGDYTNILEVDGVQTDFADFWNYYEQQPSCFFESIEVLGRTGSSLYGARGAGAGGSDILIVRIKTRKPAEVAALLQGNAAASSVIVYKPEGYAERKEFYVPPYDRPAALYWNPAIRANAAGMAAVEFYVPRGAACTCVLEGTAAGRAGYARITVGPGE